MKISFLKWIFLGFSFAAFAGSTQNFLGPIGGLQLDGQFVKDRVSGAFLGEGGNRYARVNGTLGWEIDKLAYMKFSTDYLVEKLKYRFSTGSTSKSMQQVIGGFGVGTALDACWLPFLEITGYYGYSFNRSLSEKRNLERWITGASAAGGKFGLTLVPWYTLKVVLEANYDWVKFNWTHQSLQHTSGFGGSAAFVQQLYPDYLFVEGRVEFRRPFYFYQASLTAAPTEDIRFGVYANYTDGKISIPNAAALGITLSVDFGGRCRSWGGSSKKKTPYEAMMNNEEFREKEEEAGCCYTPCLTNLYSFTMNPVVKMPLVLSRSQQKKI
jgi:hypothetical protein